MHDAQPKVLIASEKFESKIAELKKYAVLVILQKDIDTLLGQARD